MPTGLDYNALFRIARVYGIEVTPALLEKIRHMEQIALEHMTEEARRKK